MENLYNLRFHEQLFTGPVLRLAMLIVKLTIPEAHVEMSDIDKIGHKDKASLARTLEQTLIDIQRISEELHKKGQVNKVQSPIVLKYVGQTFVRIGLLALERQKDGLEKEKINLADIKKLFLTSLGNLLKGKVKFPLWHLDDTSESQVSTSDSQQTDGSSSQLVDYTEHSCPVWKAKQLGFAVDTIIFHPKSTVPCGYWTIKDVGKDGLLSIIQTVSYDDTYKEDTISLDTLVMQGWKAAQKVQLPVKTGQSNTI